MSAAFSFIFWGLCIFLMFCVLGGMFFSGVIANFFASFQRVSKEEIIEGQFEYEHGKKRWRGFR